MKHRLWTLGIVMGFIATTAGWQSPTLSSPSRIVESSKESQNLPTPVFLLANQENPDQAGESWNLALGQAVSASGFDEGFLPEYATDGLYDPYLTPPQCWRMSKDEPGWIEVEFPAKALIQQVELMVGPDAAGSAFAISARFGDGTLLDLGKFDGKPGPNGIITVDLTEPPEGVIGVRFDTLDPDYPCIYEVTVFGVSDDVSNIPPGADIGGDPETVFLWETEHCEQWNIPDLPARAFRDNKDQVNLILSHFVNYRMIGPDLNSLTVDCNMIMNSNYEADPALYDDKSWIAASYTEDGQIIHALVHHEYQGHQHRDDCPDYFPCWFNQLTMAVSTDSGATYSHSATPPDHLAASLPIPFEAGGGPTGLRNPSNIIKVPESDGSGGVVNWYYSFMNAISDEELTPAPGRDQWVCLMRTQTLADPLSWRFWDGTGFDGRFIDPYRETPADPTEHRCPPLDFDDIGAGLNETVVYNVILHRYTLIGVSADYIDGRTVWGFYYAFSDDLIEWTHRQLLAEMPIHVTVPDSGTDLHYAYPSLIDPGSPSRNFETTDMSAFLYLTRLNHGQGDPDRDLIRIPVTFSLPPSGE